MVPLLFTLTIATVPAALWSTPAAGAEALAAVPAVAFATAATLIVPLFVSVAETGPTAVAPVVAGPFGVRWV